jgi:hypothetical protein
MKKIIATLITLFVLNSCSKDSTDTSETTTTPETPVSTILPKTITKSSTTYNYVYEGNKIKSYANASKTEEYKYTYTGDLITKFSRTQNPADLKGHEYNYTYEPNNLKLLSSYAYSLYTNTYSSVSTASFVASGFQNNTFSVETMNKSNTTGQFYPYDDNLYSPPLYTINVIYEVLKTVTERRNMTEITPIPNAIVTITTVYEYDDNDAHKNPFANITGMNKLFYYDVIASATHNVSNITITYSSPTNSFSPVTHNVNYEYIYNVEGYPTQITATPDNGNPTVTKITY